jgi:hypothetical protein
MNHTVETLMALHNAATSAAVQYADCARVSLRSERTMQAADDRDEANDALRTALTEALGYSDVSLINEGNKAQPLPMEMGKLTDFQCQCGKVYGFPEAMISSQPVPPHKCKTYEEKLAYAASWWRALEANSAQPVQEPLPGACKTCGNEYLSSRTDVHKDKRPFIYCDCCGAMADSKTWYLTHGIGGDK